MAFDLTRLREMLSRRARKAGRRPDRHGQRAIIDQPGLLTICDRNIPGVIHDVGLGGVFFASAELPLAGTRGTLTCRGGKPVEVRVVWRRGGGRPGSGLILEGIPA